MPRGKKYTPARLRGAVKKYFESITYSEPVKVLYDTGRVNKQGMPVMAYRDAVNDRGEVIMQRVFAVPPSIEGLCLFLKISRQTLHNYRSDAQLGAEYSEIIDAAKLTIEAYLHRKLNEGGRVAGIIFDLECNFGWGREKTDGGKLDIEFTNIADDIMN